MTPKNSYPQSHPQLLLNAPRLESHSVQKLFLSRDQTCPTCYLQVHPVPRMAVYRVVNGKLAEQWDFADNWGANVQAGLIDPDHMRSSLLRRAARDNSTD